jgi:hypothetical protein
MEERVLRGVPYDAKADVWSLMLVCYEMAAGRLPNTSASHEFDRSFDHLAGRCDERLRAALAVGLVYAPIKRPTAAQLHVRFPVAVATGGDDAARPKSAGRLDEALRAADPTTNE